MLWRGSDESLPDRHYLMSTCRPTEMNVSSHILLFKGGKGGQLFEFISKLTLEW